MRPTTQRLAFAALALALAWGAGACAGLGFGGGARAAISLCGQRFRAGDAAGAAAALQPWLASSDAAARQALALRFLQQDYRGVLALAGQRPQALADDEARLWVARSDAALGRWDRCLARLGALTWAGRPAALSLRGEALAALGDPGAPAALAQAPSACAGTRLEAVTALLAAEDDERRGRDADAEQAYKRAQRADQAYTMVNLRLAELYRRQERWKEARIRLERARRVDPDAEEPLQELNALLAALPEQRRALKRDEARKAKRFLGRINPVVAPLAPRPGEPLVRVGLVSDAPRFQCRLGGDMRVEPGGRILPADSAWEARRGRQGWRLKPLDKGSDEADLAVGQVLRLIPLAPESTFGLFEVDHGAGYFWAGKQDRYYRGVLELRPGAQGITLVDELGLEAYLLSVVPSEARARWPAAALQAQAIAARTDAWRSLGRFQSKGYDLCPTVLCAVYAGVRVEDPRTTAAVTGTAGVVLEDGKRHLAPTYYMDNSGGHTVAASEAWSGRAGDSVGVVDAPESAKATWALFPVTPASLLHFLDDPAGDVQGWPRSSGSTWRWTLRLTPEELAPSVLRHHPIGRLRTALGLVRTDGGTLRSVKLVGDLGESVASSDRIRSAFKGVKSNLFYVELRLDGQGRTEALIFHGGGWGHGVGMSQSGAMAMAAAGLDERAILRHYFPASSQHRRYGEP
jgi:SpoIID/LytB domain protein